MTIASLDVSIVIQGPLSTSTSWDLRYTLAQIRKCFPDSPIIVATQKTASVFDPEDANTRFVFSLDPGALPSVKTNSGGAPHNFNRQQLTSAAGLAAVETPFAIKMRTDAYLTPSSVFELFDEWGDRSPGPRLVGTSRIVIASLFSTIPRYDERLSYHLSDWFHFGRTEDLRRVWDCRHYDLDMATWYERHPFAPGSLPRETEFRSRFATEQWLTLNYLFGNLENFPIQFHNDYSDQIVSEFEEYLVDNFIVAHPRDLGLWMPKHYLFYGSRYFNAICYSFEDWKELIGRKRGVTGPMSGYSMWSPNAKDRSDFIRLRGRFDRTRNRVRSILGRIR